MENGNRNSNFLISRNRSGLDKSKRIKMKNAKKILNKVSIPSKNKIENANTILNLQFGKIILQIKKE